MNDLLVRKKIPVERYFRNDCYKPIKKKYTVLLSILLLES